MDSELKKILQDNTSGSTTLTLHTLQYFKGIIDTMKPDAVSVEDAFHQIQDGGKILVKAQPNMALLRYAFSSLLQSYKRLMKTEKSHTKIIQELKVKVESLEKEIQGNIQKIAAGSSRIMAGFNKIMTTSNSTIVRLALEKAHDQKKKIEVYCLKSHPPDEGVVLAEGLVKKGIKTTLLADAGAAHFLPEMNMVLIGADRLYEDGFINKSGTLALCLMAEYLNIPVYLSVETTKILKESERAIKQRSAAKEEVYTGKSRKIQVENIYFERVPIKLVSKVICEEGVFETHEFIKWFLGE